MTRAERNETGGGDKIEEEGMKNGGLEDQEDSSVMDDSVLHIRAISIAEALERSR